MGEESVEYNFKSNVSILIRLLCISSMLIKYICRIRTNTLTFLQILIIFHAFFMYEFFTSFPNNAIVYEFAYI